MSAPAALGRLRRPGLAWVTWRQHRATLIGLALFLAALGVFIYLTSLRANGPAASFQDRCLRDRLWIPNCGSLFAPMQGAELSPLLVTAVIGVFLGAPLLAREYAGHTTQFAWTQGAGRTQLVVTKLVILALATLAAGALLGWVAHWSVASGFSATPLGYSNRWQIDPFNATALTLASGALLGLAIGVLAGAALRQVVPAMAATAAAVVGLFVLDYTTLHFRLLSLGARTTRALALGVHPSGVPAADGLISLDQTGRLSRSGPPGNWLVQGWYTGPGGHRIGGAQVTQLMNLSLRQLTARHVSFWVSYQPASRYGLLVSVQAAVTVLLALALGALAVWLVQIRKA